jgi:hypothetical protein
MMSNATSQLSTAEMMIAHHSRLSSAPAMKKTKLRMATMSFPSSASLLAAPRPPWQANAADRGNRALDEPRRPNVFPRFLGAVAQMVERLVRNEEVRGSIPLGSTKDLPDIG